MSLKGYKLIVKKKMQAQNLLLPDTPGIKTIVSVAWWSKTALFQTLRIKGLVMKSPQDWN